MEESGSERQAAIEPEELAARGNGVVEPSVASVPPVELKPGQGWYEGEDDTRCRVIREDGTRCGATRVRATGACPGHSGIGQVAIDPSGASSLANIERQRRRAARMTLGVSARRAASPLVAARVAAQARAEDFARAVVDRPLDDPDLTSVSRQRAAIAALELLYPQSTLTVTAELPDDPDAVRSLGWAELQQLALEQGIIGVPDVEDLA